jgi:hypothetical protein
MRNVLIMCIWVVMKGAKTFFDRYALSLHSSIECFPKVNQQMQAVGNLLGLLGTHADTPLLYPASS